MVLIKKIKSLIRRDEYIKNFLTLFSGTAFVQILPFFTAPITTRIYDPQDYGYTAMYAAVVGLFTLFISSHYVHFIMLSKRMKDIVNIFILTLFIAVIVTAILTILVFIIPKPFLTGILDDNYFFFLYFLPISVFLNGFGSVLGIWNNKMGKYKLMASIKIFDAVFSIVVVIGIGILIDGPYGLFIAIITGPLISSSINIASFLRNDSKYLKLVSSNWIRKLVIREIRYAIYIFPGDLINKYINLLPLFIIEFLGGKVSLGNYQFSQRILGLPINFVGTAVLEVFRKKAIDDYNSYGNCISIFKKTFSMLSLLSLLPTLTLMFFAPEIFEFVFGDKWYGAGRITQALSILYFFKMVASPLSYMYYVVRRTKEDLITQICLVVFNLSALAVGYFYFKDVFTMVLLYALSYSGIYIIQLIRSYQFAKGTVK
ncbi:oligosaccharide flippase family protein [Ekhidna sp.]|uniref:oligosaccharide flippase family protein n=1 Tax=Ekhidna sp. TaxID=2608089 RepID=UPI003C7CCE50